MGAADKARNKATKAKGKARQEAGRAIGDKGMEARGTVDRLKAKAKETGEKVEDALRGR